MNWGFETLAIHAGCHPQGDGVSTAIPIVQSASFSYDSASALEDVFAGRKLGHVYARISNPTVAALEERMVRLEGGLAAVALSSGMAAIVAVVETLCESGDHMVASSGLFGGTLTLFDEVLSRRGIGVTWVDVHDRGAWESACQDRTRLLFVESISNPKLDVANIPVLSALAASRGIPLVVDNTLTTPYLGSLRDMGAHVTVNCMGKYMSGTGGTIGGIAVDLGTFDWTQSTAPLVKSFVKRFGAYGFIAAMKKGVTTHTGACLSPMNAHFIMLGMESLALRMQRHCDNALGLAVALSEHPLIESVTYPGRSDHPDADTVATWYGGRGGAIVTCQTASKANAFALIDSLALVRRASNLGDAKTLIIHPASTIYREATPERRAMAGVTDGTVRVSVGIETLRDLIDDFFRST